MYQANIHPVTTSSSTKTMAITIANIALCPRRVLEWSTACAPADAPQQGDRGQDCDREPLASWRNAAVQHRSDT